MSAEVRTPEENLRLLMTDLPLYARNCLRIRTKDAQVLPFEFNRAQMIVQERIAKQRREHGRVRCIILKARQTGMSTFVAARFFRRVHLSANIEALIIADERKRGAKLFDIYRRFDQFLPPEVRPQTRYKEKGTHLIYDTEASSKHGRGLGSSISVETAKDQAAGRATTLQLLHVSEIAFWEKPEQVWVSLLQAVPDDDSEIIVESTANGVGNFFHELWEDAESGASGYLAIFLPWWIHDEYRMGIKADERQAILTSEDPFERMAMDEGLLLDGEFHKIEPEQLAWRRRVISERFRGDERMFRQEFPATAEEAFLVAGACFFDEDVLARYRRSAKEPSFRGAFSSDKKKGAIGIDRVERGPLRIWKKPQSGKVYAIGCDTATGRRVGQRDDDSEKGGRDFSCAYVYNVTDSSLDAVYHSRVAPEVFANDMYRLGYMYAADMGPNTGFSRPALVGVERNHSSGETVLRILHSEKRYPNLYTHRLLSRRTGSRTKVIGWMTTSETRMPMLDEFSRKLRDETISAPDADLIKECFTFVRDETGKPAAQEGAHDDRVIAAALSVEMGKWARAKLVSSTVERTVKAWSA